MTPRRRKLRSVLRAHGGFGPRQVVEELSYGFGAARSINQSLISIIFYYHRSKLGSFRKNQSAYAEPLQSPEIEGRITFRDGRLNENPSARAPGSDQRQRPGERFRENRPLRARSGANQLPLVNSPLASYSFEARDPGLRGSRTRPYAISPVIMTTASSVFADWRIARPDHRRSVR